MTAYKPIIKDEPARPDSPALPDFKEHYAQVNEWRGRCIAHFSKAELTVAETLAHLSKRSGKAIKLPHLTGQRLDRLSSIIESESKFGKPGGTAVAALAGMAALQGLRNALCHGRSTILLDERGQCYCLLEMIDQGGDKQALCLTFPDMAARETVVIERKKALCTALGQIRTFSDKKSANQNQPPMPR